MKSGKYTIESLLEAQLYLLNICESIFINCAEVIYAKEVFFMKRRHNLNITNTFDILLR